MLAGSSDCPFQGLPFHSVPFFLLSSFVCRTSLCLGYYPLASILQYLLAVCSLPSVNFVTSRGPEILHSNALDLINDFCTFL